MVRLFFIPFLIVGMLIAAMWFTIDSILLGNNNVVFDTLNGITIDKLINFINSPNTVFIMLGIQLVWVVTLFVSYILEEEKKSKEKSLIYFLITTCVFVGSMLLVFL